MRLPLLISLLLVTLAQAEPTTTASGLKYEVLKSGTGRQPKPGDTVVVHYTGRFRDGKTFDSSRDRGAPTEFMIGVGRVIDGWDEGLVLMKEGARYRFDIPLRGTAYQRGPQAFVDAIRWLSEHPLERLFRLTGRPAFQYFAAIESVFWLSVGFEERHRILSCDLPNTVHEDAPGRRGVAKRGC